MSDGTASGQRPSWAQRGREVRRLFSWREAASREWGLWLMAIFLGIPMGVWGLVVGPPGYSRLGSGIFVAICAGIGVVGLKLLDDRMARRDRRQPGLAAGNETDLLSAAEEVVRLLVPHGYSLDWWGPSLREVDRFLEKNTVRGHQRFRSPLYDRDDEWVVVALGAYVGHVLRLTIGARWDLSKRYADGRVAPHLILRSGKPLWPLHLVAAGFTGTHSDGISTQARSLGVPI